MEEGALRRGIEPLRLAAILTFYPVFLTVFQVSRNTSSLRSLVFTFFHNIELFTNLYSLRDDVQCIVEIFLTSFFIHFFHSLLRAFTVTAVPVHDLIASSRCITSWFCAREDCCHLACWRIPWEQH